MSQHTPGPWTIGQPNRPWVHNAEGKIVCYIHDSTGYEPYSGDIEANARLIAAAPELLEACKAADRLYSELRLIADPYECGPWINKLRAAIAKAEGGSDA